MPDNDGTTKADEETTPDTSLHARREARKDDIKRLHALVACVIRRKTSSPRTSLYSGDTWLHCLILSVVELQVAHRVATSTLSTIRRNLTPGRSAEGESTSEQCALTSFALSR